MRERVNERERAFLPLFMCNPLKALVCERVNGQTQSPYMRARAYDTYIYTHTRSHINKNKHLNVNKALFLRSRSFTGSQVMP